MLSKVSKKSRKKFKPWKKKLLKVELKHLKEIGVTTKKSFESLNVWHNARRKETRTMEPCFACRGIARKLGFEVYSRGKLVAVES